MAKVLLVEDDNNLREIYEARLQAEGYDTATASDGEQALVVAKEAKPDLVISDVMMPKISGFEMLDILRNTDGLKDVKVIMLTALGQAEDKTRADELGADKYLVKSQVTLEDIVKTAHLLLDDAAAPAAAAAEPVAPVAPAAPALSEPVSAAPAATPTPADDTPAATAATTADETQAMQAQIDDFAAQPAIDPPAVDPAAAAPTPDDTAAPSTVPTTPEPTAAATPVTDDAATTTHDDQVMADAVESLGGTPAEAQKPSDVTAVEVAPPAAAAAPEAPTPAEPATPESSDDSDSVTPSHKKVISPITDSTNAKPDINKLLAAEEAAATANEPVPTPPAASEVAPTPDVTEPPADPNQPNPNEIAL